MRQTCGNGKVLLETPVGPDEHVNKYVKTNVTAVRILLREIIETHTWP